MAEGQSKAAEKPTEKPKAKAKTAPYEAEEWRGGTIYRCKVTREDGAVCIFNHEDEERVKAHVALVDHVYPRGAATGGDE